MQYFRIIFFYIVVIKKLLYDDDDDDDDDDNKSVLERARTIYYKLCHTIKTKL